MLGLKAVLLGVLVAIVIFLPSVDDNDVRSTAVFLADEDLEKVRVTSGVRAALYALVGAAVLFVSLIRIRESDQLSNIVNFMNPVIGAWVAAYVGWYWLRDATEENPWPYAMYMGLLAFFALVGILAPVAAALMFGPTAGRDDNSDNDEEREDE